MAQLFVLFEHATGYALFKIAEFEEISSFVPQVQRSTSDINAFKGIVELISFHPFTTGRDALENMNSVSEGILHPHLQHFLENNLPKSKKKRPVTLGVGDSKLAAVIAEILNINCSVSGAIPEIIRGIRFYFHKLVEGIKDLESANKAQLGLGHHYSRARVKFNVNKIDNMIIQSINIVDQLDKDINTFSMRIREWYSFHFPELIKIVPENHLFIKCVGAIRDRKDMSEDIEEKLNDILMDNDKVQRVVEVAHSSMGMDISPLDMDNITVFAIRINSLMNRRKELLEYLKSKMHSVAPNLATLIGELVGARLIAHAGSLINLAKFPASTVQILGAEKALFRALKTRGNTPKYGLIYHSTFIGRAGKTNKGRISRYLANKCSVASRIDCFRDIPTEVFGSKLRQQVEDRLKFYETGELPDKNVDVMTSALTEADIAAVAIAKERRKAEKRARKRLSQQMENITNDSINNDNEVSELSMIDSEPKKKKRKHSQELNNSLGNSFDANTNDESGVFEQNAVNSVKKKKKHKKQMAENDAVEELSPNKLKFEEQTAENIAEELSAKKVDTDEEIDENYAAALAKAKRKAEKKERKRLAALANMSQDSIVSDGSPLKDNGENSFEQSMTNSEKKKKKKKNKHSIEE